MMTKLSKDNIKMGIKIRKIDKRKRNHKRRQKTYNVIGPDRSGSGWHVSNDCCGSMTLYDSELKYWEIVK